jgi:hypothetical protein
MSSRMLSFTMFVPLVEFPRLLGMDEFTRNFPRPVPGWPLPSSVLFCPLPLSSISIDAEIGTQVALLLVASILLAHLVATSVFYFLMPGPPFLAERIAAARLENLAGILDSQADPSRRAELLQLALRMEPDLSILHRKPAPAPAPVRQRILKALQVSGDDRIVVGTAQAADEMPKRDASPILAIQLAGDTMWLALSLPFGPPRPGIASPMIIATLLFFRSA